MRGGYLGRLDIRDISVLGFTRLSSALLSLAQLDSRHFVEGRLEMRGGYVRRFDIGAQCGEGGLLDHLLQLRPREPTRAAAIYTVV